MCLVTGSLFSQNFNYLSDYDNQGVPLDMVNTTISQSLVNNINASLPEGYPVPDYNPQYISSGVETDVMITELADVWVSFVGEGAGYKNVLGFYTYDLDNPPTTVPADEDITIIFPNVSAAGSGGGLITGDKMYLGLYPANTGIGWVLIANGWNGNGVGYGNWILYSNPSFNPEADPELQKHNVNLYDGNEQVVVLGFEDIRRDYSSCDQDFNDALFLVTTNPYEAMETSNYNQITYDGGGQSSGNDGGLESNRGLSNKIAKRSFDRSHNSAPMISEEIGVRSDHFFDRVVPSSFDDQDRREITSPIDLESITIADIIWSADYFKDDMRYATIFATETSEKVYDHTKVVCDRLSGSELIDIREVEIKDNTMILSSLLTPENNIEYSISFSLMMENESKYRVFSRWAVDQYSSTGKHYNFQIWSSAPFSTINMVMEILDVIEDEIADLTNDDSVSCAPDVFIEKGTYSGNRIDIQIKNRTDVTKTVNLIGSMTQTEIDEDLELHLRTLNVPPGSHSYTIESLENSMFDLEIKVKESNKESYDVAYFSDGAWGLDFDRQHTDVEDYIITPNEAESNGFHVARDVSLTFNTKDYLSVYKHLKPSRGIVDLTAYNTLKVDLQTEVPVKITLVKKGLDEWADQFSFVYHPDEDSEIANIPFSYFRNSSNEVFKPNDIQIIVFTIEGNVKGSQQLDIANVQFVESRSSEREISNGFEIFPNPTSNKASLEFNSTSDLDGQMNVYNVSGKKVHSRTLDISSGVNVIKEDFSILTQGVYFIEITNDQFSYNKKIVIMR